MSVLPTVSDTFLLSLTPDSEAEEWMFAGMAVRLAIDLGIHLEVGSQQGISAEDRRLNRLVFWSVILLDFALAFGTGRQPTFRVSEISSALPTEEDLPVPIASPRHPFPYACRMMFSYGRLIELLNSREDDMDGSKQREIQKCKMRAVREYAQLPPDIRWDVQKWVTTVPSCSLVVYSYIIKLDGHPYIFSYTCGCTRSS